MTSNRPELDWVVGGLRSPGYIERYRLRPPADVRVHDLREDLPLEAALAAGEIDVLFSVTPPSTLRPPQRQRIRRLFPRPEEVEREYHERTGLFPIMHLVVVKRELYDADPGLAQAIFDSFQLAKEVGMERLRYTSCLAVGIPGLKNELRRIDESFGGDAFPYGVASNRREIDAVVGCACEQGLTSRFLQMDELFAGELMDT